VSKEITNQEARRASDFLDRLHGIHASFGIKIEIDAAVYKQSPELKCGSCGTSLSSLLESCPVCKDRGLNLKRITDDK